MFLRNHKELSPWPNLFRLGAVGVIIPGTFELLDLIIQNIHLAYPVGINIEAFPGGADNCIWRNVFKDTNFAFALFANKGKLIGKTLREAGDIEIS